MGWSTKRKRGRPKVATQPRDYGNERVQARIALFRSFRGDSGIGHEMTCAGRLMLVGAFDGLEHDPEVLLSALLEYQNAYWGQFPGASAIATYERTDRSHDSRWEDPRGEWFEMIDQRLRNCGHATRVAVHQATVDRAFFPDEDVSWAARVINTRCAQKGLPVAGELAGDSDWATLELLRQGAIALVGNVMRRAA